ncbi:hypothetical protein GYMLUDRAFT_730369 [Collybiopsis luxurians FD-317 M1]|nr:hypothetical protein GYMLUDRAFT_730369 [Collybiopsis luxurians FD-317 M1]
MNERRKPIKKALLIGIKTTLQSQVESLKQPHTDVRIIRDLLIKQYDYKEANIVTLLDCRSHLQDFNGQPTHDNIMGELHALVADAQPHDHLFFYYAGHVDQKPTNDPKEEDGLNEFILACDSTGVDHNAIQDDLLREILIENLPAQCKLTAVIDACHSGTLLDLDHWRCNRGRLKFPFRPEYGNLKKSFTLPHNSGSPGQKGLAVYENRRTSDDKFTQCKVTLRQSERNPEGTHAHATTSNTTTGETAGITKRSTMPNDPPPPARTSTSISANILGKLRKTSTSMSANAHTFWKHKSPLFNGRNATSHVHPAVSKSKGSVPLKKATHFDMPRCTSPDQLTRSLSSTLCDGDGCRQREGEKDDEDLPVVIALSACDDAQRAWESKNMTMTKMVVNLLQKNPHPKLGHMMDMLGHKIHNATTSLHKESRQYQERVMRYNRRHPSRAKPFDGSNLNLNEQQDLQLSSLKPLVNTSFLHSERHTTDLSTQNMNRPWSP